MECNIVTEPAMNETQKSFQGGLSVLKLGGSE